jgi:hypothetical protein
MRMTKMMVSQVVTIVMTVKTQRRARRSLGPEELKWLMRFY